MLSSLNWWVVVRSKCGLTALKTKASGLNLTIYLTWELKRGGFILKILSKKMLG